MAQGWAGRQRAKPNPQLCRTVFTKLGRMGEGSRSWFGSAGLAAFAIGTDLAVGRARPKISNRADAVECDIRVVDVALHSIEVSLAVSRLRGLAGLAWLKAWRTD